MTAPIVVGAGPAGISATLTLVEAGLRPIVIDEAARAGGQIFRRPPPGFTRPPSQLYGADAAAGMRLHQAFDALGGRIDYRPETLVWSIEPDAVHLQGPAGRDRLDRGPLLLATGATDRLLPIPGWTKPGVFSLGGSQVALKAQGCAIGRRVVFCGTGPLLYLVAYQYAKAGAEVAAVLDTSRFADSVRALPLLAADPAKLVRGVYYLGWLRAHGVPVHYGVRPLTVHGEAVSRLTWRDGDRRLNETACDALALGFGLRSETQTADLAGVPFRFDAGRRQYLPETDEDGRSTAPAVYLAGDGAAVRGAAAAETAGRLAAFALLADLGHQVDAAEQETLRRRMARFERFARGLDLAFPFPVDLLDSADDDTLLCRCEAVTIGSLRHAVTDLGAEEVNRAKAFVRPGMGRCQGRMCGLATAELYARTRGLALEQAGRLRGQAPVKPIPLA
jgi:NADPH-dependent 2,4-dienoyl-CoA reductase/sulfur reductase-like enzyme